MCIYKSNKHANSLPRNASMSGTVLAEAGWHMEAVLEGSAPAGGIKQPEVEGPGIDARVFAIG